MHVVVDRNHSVGALHARRRRLRHATSNRSTRSSTRRPTLYSGWGAASCTPKGQTTMPLTAHDAEERSRPLIGRVMDAREKVTDTRDTALDGPEQARAHLVALRELTHRQDDLIAELREQVRQAIEPYYAGTDSLNVGFGRTNDDDRAEDA